MVPHRECSHLPFTVFNSPLWMCQDDPGFPGVSLDYTLSNTSLEVCTACPKEVQINNSLTDQNQEDCMDIEIRTLKVPCLAKGSL